MNLEPKGADKSFLVTNKGLVDLDLVAEPFPLRPTHRSAKLLEHGPGSLVAANPKLALQLKRGQAGRVCRHEVRRPEPVPQRHPRPVEHRPGCHRGLVPTRLALPEKTPPQVERFGMPAARTPVALRPARLGKVGATGFLVNELGLKVPHASRKDRPPHGHSTLHIRVFGVKRISRTDCY